MRNAETRNEKLDLRLTPSAKRALQIAASAESIEVGDLPNEIAKRLPRYPRLPAPLIGRLAVAQRYHGQGAGEFLLLDALKRNFDNTDVIGSIAVVVDTLEEPAVLPPLRLPPFP